MVRPTEVRHWRISAIRIGYPSDAGQRETATDRVMLATLFHPISMTPAPALFGAAA